MGDGERERRKREGGGILQGASKNRWSLGEEREMLMRKIRTSLRSAVVAGIAVGVVEEEVPEEGAFDKDFAVVGVGSEESFSSRSHRVDKS